jgi:hypothetical protein
MPDLVIKAEAAQSGAPKQQQTPKAAAAVAALYCWLAPWCKQQHQQRSAHMLYQMVAYVLLSLCIAAVARSLLWWGCAVETAAVLAGEQQGSSAPLQDTVAARLEQPAASSTAKPCFIHHVW